MTITGFLLGKWIYLIILPKLGLAVRIDLSYYKRVIFILIKLYKMFVYIDGLYFFHDKHALFIKHVMSIGKSCNKPNYCNLSVIFGNLHGDAQQKDILFTEAMFQDIGGRNYFPLYPHCQYCKAFSIL